MRRSIIFRLFTLALLAVSATATYATDSVFLSMRAGDWLTAADQPAGFGARPVLQTFIPLFALDIGR